MTFRAEVVRVFLASPSDTVEDRAAVRNCLAEWNVEHAAAEEVVLFPVGWETDAVPEWGDHPQSILNKQLLDDCDVLIGVLWTRLGTPTPEGESGTVEEIERFAATGKPTMIYYCRRLADLSTVDTKQLDAVRAFEATCKERSLYESYGDTPELASKIKRAMSRLARERFSPRREMQETDLPKGTRLTGTPSLTRRASLGGYLESHGRSQRLIISNPGTIDVHQVNVEVPPEASSFQLVASELPIDVLRPGERVGISAVTFMGGGKTIFDVWLTGQAESGESLRVPVKVSL